MKKQEQGSERRNQQIRMLSGEGKGSSKKNAVYMPQALLRR
ncbi:hypothetical protein [Thermotalea metallivorans]|nr:hypothetical protein [Thermotalea metallivorans]